MTCCCNGKLISVNGKSSENPSRICILLLNYLLWFSSYLSRNKKVSRHIFLWVVTLIICTKLKNWCCFSTICGTLSFRYHFKALNEWSMNLRFENHYFCEFKIPGDWKNELFPEGPTKTLKIWQENLWLLVIKKMWTILGFLCSI